MVFYLLSLSDETNDGPLGSLECRQESGISSHDEYFQTTEGSLEQPVR
jgi:hypothetical protein